MEPFTNSSGPVYIFSYLRDSLSYTVNNYGRILFSSEDFSSVFKTYTFGPNNATPDTLIVTEQMGYKDAAVTVEAGTFITFTFRRIYHFPAVYKYGSIRDYDYRYAKNVGLVSETSSFFQAGPEVYERRLVRYHVE